MHLCTSICMYICDVLKTEQEASCMGEPYHVASQVNFMHLFLTPHSVMSHSFLENGYGLSIYTVCVCVCMRSVSQSRLTLCDLMDCSLPGSSVHGVFQAGILEWVAISSSRGSSPHRDWIKSPSLAGEFYTAEPCRNTRHWQTALDQLQENIFEHFPAEHWWY